MTYNVLMGTLNPTHSLIHSTLSLTHSHVVFYYSLLVVSFHWSLNALKANLLMFIWRLCFRQ